MMPPNIPPAMAKELASMRMNVFPSRGVTWISTTPPFVQALQLRLCPIFEIWASIAETPIIAARMSSASRSWCLAEISPSMARSKVRRTGAPASRVPNPV